MQYLRASFLVLSAALCGCVSIPAKPAPERLSVDVTSLSATGASLVNPHSFAYALPTGEEPLVDQRLAEEFGQRMGARLHTRKDKSPDWLIQVSHSVSATDDLIPEKRTYEHYFDPGQDRLVTEYHNGLSYSRMIPGRGQWKDRPHVTPATERPAYNLKVVVRIYAASAAPPVTPNALPLWEGSIVSHQLMPDPLHYAPAMMRELIREFPKPSGSREQRQILAAP